MKKLHYFNQYLYESMQGSLDPKDTQIIRAVQTTLGNGTNKIKIENVVLSELLKKAGWEMVEGELVIKGYSYIRMDILKGFAYELSIPNMISFYKEYLNGNQDILDGVELMKANGQVLIDIVAGAAGQPAPGSGNTKGNKGVETGNLGYPAGKNLYESNDDMNPLLALIIVIALFILSLYFNDPSIGVH